MLSKKIVVKKVISQRYPSGVARPMNWDERIDGVDTIESNEGVSIKLHSTGQQSVPQPGWVILVDDKNPNTPATWTLFGLPSGASMNS